MRCVLVLTLALAACAATPVAPDSPRRFAASPPQPLDPALPKLLPALPQIEATVDAQFAELEVPNLTVGLVADGALVWSKGYGQRDPGQPGPPDAKTVFRLGSLTKLFTGVALLQLRDAGRLDFDAPAERYLPELARVVYPTRDSPAITVRHLVTHTSGLPRVGKLDYARGDREQTEAELLAAVDGQRLSFVPGTKRSYSNLAVALAGLVIARVSGVDYTRYVSERVLAPLGLTSGAWTAEAVPSALLGAGARKVAGGYQPVTPAEHWRLGATAAAGGLYLSLQDLARFAAFEASAWPPRDDAESPVLRRASLRESQLAFGHGISGGFGVAWGVREDPRLGHLVSHTGSTTNYSAAIALLPRRGFAVVAFTGSGEHERLAALAHTVLGLAVDAVPPPEPKLGDAMQEVLGRVLALMAAPDAAGLERAFAPGFLRVVPTPRLLEIFQQMQKVGACPKQRVLSADEGRAVVRLECEHAAMELMVAAPTEQPRLIEAFYAKPAK